jgi:hypothetical protein
MRSRDPASSVRLSQLLERLLGRALDKMRGFNNIKKNSNR